MPTLTNNRIELEQAIAAGIDFLHAAQLPSGYFRIFCSPDPLLAEHCKEDFSTFQVAQIAHCLGFLRSQRAEEMARTAVRFLLSVMQSGGVWRYTCSPNPDYLPPDVDDTAIISSLLHRHGVAVPENTHVLLGNRASSGLFHTWILPRFTRGASTSYWAVALRQLLKLPQLFWFFRVTECKPNDVDPVVNANVLHYLGERPETRPIIANLIRILAEQKEDTCDKYYGSRFTFYYFLSRNHAAGIGGFESVADTIVGRIKAHAHAGGVIGDHILHTALAACTLMDWQDYSAVLDNAILAILQARTSGGAWQKCPFYFSGWMKKLGWGSEELTTGFCLEALARYRLLQTHGD